MALCGQEEKIGQPPVTDAGVDSGSLYSSRWPLCFNQCLKARTAPTAPTAASSKGSMVLDARFIAGGLQYNESWL